MKHLKTSTSIIVACILLLCSNPFCEACAQSTPGRESTVKRVSGKPNIVFIMSDDHAYQAISAYSNKLIRTPNIDQIGRQGAVLYEAAVTNSVCSPSRAVILTGKYSHKNGMKDNGTYFSGSQRTLPKILQQHGYKTALIGKWHLFSQPTGFDYWDILPDQGNYYNPAFSRMGKDTVYKGYVTDVITDLSLSWIDENSDKPFFLMLHHKAPHRNWMPPIKYLGLFNDRSFERPTTFDDPYTNKPALQRQLVTVKDNLDIRYDSKMPCDSCPVGAVNNWAPAEFQREIERLSPTERKSWDSAYAHEFERFKKIKSREELIRFQFQRYMEDYLRCVKSVDDNVGRVLTYLREKGLEENTIVIYTSDQGFFLGEHGLYDKRFMYKESFRTPFLIRYPRLIPANQRLNEYTLNLDIAPTLLDYAGINIPSDMQGVSMKTLLAKGKDPDWRKEVYYHYYEKSFGLTAHYGIRTKDYKLIRFYDPVQSWELYDLKIDPNELQNVYTEPRYTKKIADLKNRLAGLQKQFGDEVVEAVK